MNSFHECITAAKEYLADNRIDCPEFLNELFTGGISYNETRTFNYEIETMKGKKTRKWFHFVVCRKDNGLYEVMNYVL